MVQINFANKEIQCKIVYYGPGMSGKTTNLEVVHKKAPKSSKGGRRLAKNLVPSCRRCAKRVEHSVKKCAWSPLTLV